MPYAQATDWLRRHSCKVRMASTSAHSTKIHIHRHPHPNPHPRSYARGAPPMRLAWGKTTRDVAPAHVSSTLSSHFLHGQREIIAHESPGSCYALSVHVRNHLLPSVGQQIAEAAVKRAACHLWFFRLARSRRLFRCGPSISTKQSLSWYHGYPRLLRLIQLQLRPAHWSKPSCWLEGKDPPIEPVLFGLGETSWIRLVATSVRRSMLHPAP